jgi:glycosyltransferase involved in cell wall biosynthesis
MFKIAIDISPLHDGNSVRGVGYYTKNLVESLQKVTKTNPDFKNFQIDLVTNRSQLSSNKYDLIHYPYFDPFFLTLPFIHHQPFIISIHDLMPLQFKNHYPIGIKGEIKWQIQRFLARRANYLITDSHFSKYIISDLLSYPTDKIYVTYLAADKSYKPITDTKFLSQIKHKYNLPDKFILNVGDVNWNKNIPNLVKTCLKLKYPVVIVGSAAIEKVPVHPWTKDIHWLQSQTSPLIIRPGYIPDSDLPALFQLATIYCQPSYAEGFGLGVVKAMQIGTPVVYSQETSLPEIMDFNGEFFDPYKPQSLELSLKKLWNDPKLLSQYSKLGLSHSKTFSWDNTAIQTLTVYKLTLLYGK